MKLIFSLTQLPQVPRSGRGACDLSSTWMNRKSGCEAGLQQCCHGNIKRLSSSTVTPTSPHPFSSFRSRWRRKDDNKTSVPCSVHCLRRLHRSMNDHPLSQLHLCPARLADTYPSQALVNSYLPGLTHIALTSVLVSVLLL